LCSGTFFPPGLIFQIKTLPDRGAHDFWHCFFFPPVRGLARGTRCASSPEATPFSQAPFFLGGRHRCTPLHFAVWNFVGANSPLSPRNANLFCLASLARSPYQALGAFSTFWCLGKPFPSLPPPSWVWSPPPPHFFANVTPTAGVGFFCGFFADYFFSGPYASAVFAVCSSF